MRFNVEGEGGGETIGLSQKLCHLVLSGHNSRTNFSHAHIKTAFNFKIEIRAQYVM